MHIGDDVGIGARRAFERKISFGYSTHKAKPKLLDQKTIVEQLTKFLFLPKMLVAVDDKESRRESA